MAGTIPRLLERIPAHESTEMHANGGTLVEDAGMVPVGCDLADSPPEDRPFSTADLVGGAPVAGSYQVGILRDDSITWPDHRYAIESIGNLSRVHASSRANRFGASCACPVL